MPWRARDFVQHQLRRRAGRPQLKRDPLDSGTTLRSEVNIASISLSTVAKLLSGAAIIAVGLALVWYWTHPRVLDAAVAAECRQHYARAATHADTVRIDGLVPELTGKSQVRMTCGDLRHAYPDLFAAH